MATLRSHYPWTHPSAPLIIGAPMRQLSLPPLAVSVSAAGGIGFIGAGDDFDKLDGYLEQATRLIQQQEQDAGGCGSSGGSLARYHAETGVLPVGVGIFNWAVPPPSLADSTSAATSTSTSTSTPALEPVNGASPAVNEDDGGSVDNSNVQKVIISAITKHKPIALWMFGAHKNSDYTAWTRYVRHVSQGRTKVWVQVGCVGDAVEVALAQGDKNARPDVLVIQGTDAGGHGLEVGAGIVTLLPEVIDALASHGLPTSNNSGLNSGQSEQVEGPADPAKDDGTIHLVAAGGIIDPRSVVAAHVLGADAVALGTRFLASEEVTIARGYQSEIIRASDGGTKTARTKLYDTLRGTTSWPERYNARGVLNRSHWDAVAGLGIEENKRLYGEAMKASTAATTAAPTSGDGGSGDGTGDVVIQGWGIDGRITTYAGTGVGLIRRVMKAGDIVKELQEGTGQILRATQARLGG